LPFRSCWKFWESPPQGGFKAAIYRHAERANKQKKGWAKTRRSVFLAAMGMHRWTRRTTERMEEIWNLRLAHVDPQRVMMSTRPGSGAMVVHVFGPNGELEALRKKFGGRVSKLPPEVWAGDPKRPRAPIPIRGKLRIYGDAAAFREESGDGRGILIPAGMAFGTGDHATTATCLRLLCDLAKDLPPGWKALDAGTGTGILAVAAEKLGASQVEAFDFDPVCIRVAKANARANGCRRIRFSVADSRKAGGFGKADVVLANLYSELLVESAPGLAAKLPAGGWLVFSGVLKRQAAGVCAALAKCGFEKPKTVARGKWVAGLARRRAVRPGGGV
jgi:ribosomal protein L11 methyltransferase